MTGERPVTGKQPVTGARPVTGDVAAVAGSLRQILAGITGDDRLLAMPLDTPLLAGGAGLGSLAGTLLLREVHRRFGVDVAAEDLNLDALATLGTLAAFIAARAGGQTAGPAGPDQGPAGTAGTADGPDGGHAGTADGPAGTAAGTAG